MGSSTNKSNISSLMLFLSITALVIIALLIAVSMVFDGFSTGRYKNPVVASKVVKGTIFDRNGRALALEVPIYKVVVSSEPNDNSTVSQLISLYVDMTPDEISGILSNDGFPIEISEITSEKAEEIEKVLVMDDELSCITIQKDYQRIYPYAFHCAQLIYETERVFEPVLSPRPGFNENITYGNDVYITNDVDIQYLLDLAVQQVYDFQSPDYVVGLILDLTSSQVLANSTYPFFDLNDISGLPSSLLENKALVTSISTDEVTMGPLSQILKVTNHLSGEILNDYEMNGDFTKDQIATLMMLDDPDMTTSIVKLIPANKPKYIVFIGSRNAHYYENSTVLATVVDSLVSGLEAQGKI